MNDESRRSDDTMREELAPPAAGTDNAATTHTTHTPYAGKPLDGSQYHEVIEEQIYSELRPSAAEQTPRYSYLNPPPTPGRKRKST